MKLKRERERRRIYLRRGEDKKREMEIKWDKVEIKKNEDEERKKASAKES